MINKVQLSIVSAGALAAALPGMASIQSGLATPPGYGGLFGGVQIALTALTLIALFISRKKISEARKKNIKITAFLVAAFFVSITCYLALLSHCVVFTVNDSKPQIANDQPKPDAHSEMEERTAHIFPIVTTGVLAERIAETSRQQVADRYARGIDDLLKDQGVLVTITVSILLFLYSASMALLSAAFAVAGIQYEGSVRRGSGVLPAS